MASEIKIAEIVEMHCEEEFLTEEEQNVEFRAEMVDVGCDLDREVAELMRDGREGRLSIQAFLPSVLTDWREGEGQETIRLVVQDYDVAGGGGDTGGETPAELPDLEWGQDSPTWVREGRPVRRFLGGFRTERELAACKDTDSGCSVTSDHGDEEVYEVLGSNKVTLGPRSPGILMGSKEHRDEEAYEVLSNKGSLGPRRQAAFLPPLQTGAASRQAAQSQAASDCSEQFLITSQSSIYSCSTDSTGFPIQDR